MSQAKEQKNMKKHPEMNLYKHLPIAAASAALAELATFPIDTVKVYQQLQTRIDGTNSNLPHELEVGSGHSGMKSGHSHHTKPVGLLNFFRASKHIYSEHGIKGGYRGWKPAVLRASLNNALSATIYKPVRRALGYENRDCPFYIKLSSGIITGSCTQILAAPTDLLKVRMQADSVRATPRYHGFVDAIKTIYSAHGLLAFWKGLGPSMLRAGFSVAATLGSYDHAKSYFLKHTGMDEKDKRIHLMCSMCSGFAATMLACPFDVIKTRYQSQSMSFPTYSSATHCLSEIVKNDGMSVLFRGFMPMYARLGPWQIIFFLTFESLHEHVLGDSF